MTDPGNHDSDHRYRAIIEWYESSRKEANHRDISPLIEERLRNETGDLERKALFEVLSSEYTLHGNNEKAKQTIQRLVDEYPDDTRARIQLAEVLLFFDPQSDASRKACEDAVHAAEASDTFFREALGVKARLGLASKRYDIFREAVSRIVAYGLRPGATDIGVERDFIDRAPEGAISPELRTSYNSLYDSYWRR